MTSNFSVCLVLTGVEMLGVGLCDVHETLASELRLRFRMLEGMLVRVEGSCRRLCGAECWFQPQTGRVELGAPMVSFQARYTAFFTERQVDT